MRTPLTPAQKDMLEVLVLMADLDGIPQPTRDDLNHIYEDVWRPNQPGALDVGFVSDKELADAIRVVAA